MKSRKGTVRSKMVSSSEFNGAWLKSRLWHLVIQYAATVYNACPHSALNAKWSEEVWGRVPNLVQFQTFGSVCHVLQSKELLKDLEDRSLKSFFMERAKNSRDSTFSGRFHYPDVTTWPRLGSRRLAWERESRGKRSLRRVSEAKQRW